MVIFLVMRLFHVQQGDVLLPSNDDVEYFVCGPSFKFDNARLTLVRAILALNTLAVLVLVIMLIWFRAVLRELCDTLKKVVCCCENGGVIQRRCLYDTVKMGL